MRTAAPIIGIPLTAILAATTLAAFVIPALGQLLSIDLSAPTQIQAHQILGCHLLHWSAEHLLWDLSMFCILGGLCERWWPMRYYATIALAAISIPLVVLVFQPVISSYRGLSGIDTAIFALFATKILMDSLCGKDWFHALLFAGLLVSLVAKVGYEFATGELLFVSEVNFIPLPLAHLAGGIMGAFVALVRTGPSTPRCLPTLVRRGRRMDVIRI